MFFDYGNKETYIEVLTKLQKLKVYFKICAVWLKELVLKAHTKTAFQLPCKTSLEVAKAVIS